MKTIIATEAININEGKITLQHPATNIDNSFPILNKGLVFDIAAQQWLPITEDTSDEQHKTWIVEGVVEELQDKQIMVQYTISTNTLITGLSSDTVIATETVILESPKIKLKNKPWNEYGGCPILTAGYGVIRNKEGNLLYLPTTPDPENLGGDTILIPVSVEQFQELELEGSEFTIQYLYECSDVIDEQAVICTETVTITDGKLILSNEPNNILNESPFLNLGIISTSPDENGNIIQFHVLKQEGNVCIIPGITEEDTAVLEGKEVLIQYTKTIPADKSVKLTDGMMNSSDIGITPEMIAEAKAKAESETSSDMDLSQLNGSITSEQLGVDPEMLRKAREEAEQRDGGSFSGSVLEVVDEDEDDIADGEFTEVAE